VDGLLHGMAIGLWAGIVPGPLIALFLDHTVRHGWRRTLPAVFAPLVSDGPIILLVVFILAQVPDALLVGLRIAGGVFLIALAARTFRRPADASGPASWPHVGTSRTGLFRTAVAVNLLNPNPYIFWGIALGPTLLIAWRTDPPSALAFVLGFYAVMIGVFAGWVFLFARTAAIPPNVQYRVPVLAALILVGFGIYQIAAGLGQIRLLI